MLAQQFTRGVTALRGCWRRIDRLSLQEIAVTLVCGIAALLRLPPNRSDVIPRQRCLLLFSIYGIFIWAALAAGRYPPNS